MSDNRATLSNLLLTQRDLVEKIDLLGESEEDSLELYNVVTTLIKKIDNIGFVKNIYENEIAFLKEEKKSIDKLIKSKENNFNRFINFVHKHVWEFGSDYEDKNKKGKKLKGDRVTLKAWNKEILRIQDSSLLPPSSKTFCVALEFKTDEEREEFIKLHVDNQPEASNAKLEVYEKEEFVELTKDTPGVSCELEPHVTILGA